MQVTITTTYEIEDSVNPDTGPIDERALGAIGVTYFVNEYGTAEPLPDLDQFEAAVLDNTEHGDLGELVADCGYSFRVIRSHIAVD